MKRDPLISIFFPVILLSVFYSSFAYGRDISDLCKRAGIEGDELGRVKEAYIEAVDSGIDEGELYGFFEVIVNHGLNCTQLVSVLSKSAVLKRSGLPFWPLFSKVREGITKGVPPGKIVEVVEEKTDSLNEAALVIQDLKGKHFVIKDHDGALVSISSYIEKGYTSKEIVERISERGLEYSGFSGLTEVMGREKN